MAEGNEENPGRMRLTRVSKDGEMGMAKIEL